jgi:carboxylesterase type B
MVGQGAPIPTNPFELMSAGKVAPDVEVIFSACSQDAVMFMDLAFPNGTISFVDYIGLVTDIWGLENVPPITSRYPSLTSGSQRLVGLEKLATDYLFVCSARYVARQLSAAASIPVHMFVFDHVLSFGVAAWGPNYTFCDHKVCHGAELAFEFGSGELNYTLTAAEYVLQKDVQTAVGNFAVSGDPNSPTALQQRWGAVEENTTYVFGTPSSVTQSYNEGLCDFWDSEVGYHHAGNFIRALQKRMKRRN